MESNCGNISFLWPSCFCFAKYPLSGFGNKLDLSNRSREIESGNSIYYAFLFRFDPIGRVNENTDTSPNLLSTQIKPLFFSTNSRQITNPRPVPVSPSVP